MIVEFKKVTDVKEFRELSNGAVFGFADCFYIKMAYDLETEDDTFNAVTIDDGFPSRFFDDEEVTEYPKAKTVIE